MIPVQLGEMLMIGRLALSLIEVQLYNGTTGAEALEPTCQHAGVFSSTPPQNVLLCTRLYRTFATTSTATRPIPHSVPLTPGHNPTTSKSDVVISLMVRIIAQTSLK